MRAFTDQLRDLDKGQCVERLTERLADVVNGVVQHGKKGELKLTLTVLAPGKQERSMLAIKYDISTKVPGPETADTFMFVGESGVLTRRDPRQHDIEEHLTSIDGGKQSDHQDDSSEGA